MAISALAPSTLRMHARPPRFGEDRKRACGCLPQAVIAAAVCALSSGSFAKDPRDIPSVLTAFQRAQGMSLLRGPGNSPAVLTAVPNATSAVNQTTLNSPAVILRSSGQTTAPAKTETTPGTGSAGLQGSAPRSDSPPSGAGGASSGLRSAPGSNGTGNALSNNAKGESVLAAGKSVELVDPAEPYLSVEVTAPASSALNLSQIMSATARSGIFAGLTARREIPSARAAVVTADHRIWLKSTLDGAGFDGNGPRRGGHEGKRHSHRTQESSADRAEAASKVNTEQRSAAPAAEKRAANPEICS